MSLFQEGVLQARISIRTCFNRVYKLCQSKISPHRTRYVNNHSAILLIARDIHCPIQCNQRYIDSLDVTIIYSLFLYFVENLLYCISQLPRKFFIQNIIRTMIKIIYNLYNLHDEVSYKSKIKNTIEFYSISNICEP